MTGSYKMMKHKSVFFKLPVVDRNFKMLAWTTTPWTLSANVSLAVNPEIDYVEVKVKSDEQPIVLAKNAIMPDCSSVKICFLSASSISP